MSTTIGIACEDNGHFVAVTRLADDRLLLAHGWLDGILGDCRVYRGMAGNEPWYKYDPDDANDIRPVVVDGVRIRRHGLIGGKRLLPEASMWRNTLLRFCQSERPPEAIILVRDQDGHPERKRGMEQARDGYPWPFPIVVAVAQPEVEAWHVCGFLPNDAGERERLTDLARELSFDPTTSSHRLTSHPNDAATDAKRVLARLCDPNSDPNPDRKAACLGNPSLLRARGVLNGVADFLDEVDRRIVPLFGATR